MDQFTDLTKDKGVWKKTLQEGKGNKPKDNSIVEINYKGALENEKLFEEQNGFCFKLNNQEVIKAFEIAIKTMSKGEIAIVVVRHDYGYGKEEFQGIPSFSTLLFYIELIDIR